MQTVRSNARIKVVVVEDDLAHQEELLIRLRDEGYDALGADCGESLDELAKEGMPDLLIIDLNLPQEDGLSIASRYRHFSPDVLIILLTGRVRPGDKVMGYEAGADLYLTKPLRSRELLAAIKSLTRRLRVKAIQHDHWSLDLQSGVLESPSQQFFSLGEVAVQILEAFAQAPDQKISTVKLLELLGLPSDNAGRRALAVVLTRIRSKLRPSLGSRPLIKSIRLEGYKLCISLRVLR
jgi:DNA-binding response OmpR family regulator